MHAMSGRHRQGCEAESPPELPVNGHGRYMPTTALTLRPPLSLRYPLGNRQRR